MKATIKVDMSNAAFEGNAGVELARILGGAANWLPSYPLLHPFMSFVLRDANGNTVGSLRIEAE